MRIYALSALCSIAATVLSAQTFTTVHSFDNTDGQNPSGMVQATDGNLYGVTTSGGSNKCFLVGGCGTIFRLTPDGTLSTLYTFMGTDGEAPKGFVQANFGYFYGTTFAGGAHGGGTVFNITLKGKLTPLYNFCSQTACADGRSPNAGLIQAADGNFYGTTQRGGANNGGTVFKITPTGTLTTLYSFCSLSACADGKYPYAGVIQTTTGDLYGTTASGGTNNAGALYKITTAGTLTPLYSFCSAANCTDGASSYAALLQTPDNDLFGTTFYGGVHSASCSAGCGTVFRITPSGMFLTLHSFCAQNGCADGVGPSGALIQATNGDVYGTTNSGGAGGAGTIFQLTPTDKLSVPYSFCSQNGCADGSGPTFLMQATDGTFYGTALYAGAGSGTIFSLSLGLGPFVETRSPSGAPGSAVEILGTDLTGSTTVTFNGTPATFKVISASLILAAVPAGASSGTIQVVTSNRTLSSNIPFTVVP